MLDADSHLAALNRDDVPFELPAVDFDLGWCVVHHDKWTFGCENVNEELRFSPVEPPVVNRDSSTAALNCVNLLIQGLYEFTNACLFLWWWHLYGWINSAKCGSF